ncbi:ribose 5-phosphate isomerase B [Pilibacter termitis]|jgi:ribose 5-phosphate isomerase B|uniref:Ribose 5-phosphate isomerase B n=1 Tax=Pilibacter termitis TaxID=263852 RepID=A0A1T4LZ25_9ENTE|nr:ribose 5-phosphate isomerase B [Pilibacter termitis]SJZ59891.1 ribose 5-phosphate isomerase B [Pilibacter termitis]
MKIAIASDHGGFQLKNALIQHLVQKGIEVEDYGTQNDVASVDYPYYGRLIGEAVVNQKADYGIAICGTGIGISIAANKVSGVRAALCHDVFSAKATREHNDSNVLCMGQRVIGEGLACLIVDTWLEAVYQGGRHEKRVQMLNE